MSAGWRRGFMGRGWSLRRRVATSMVERALGRLRMYGLAVFGAGVLYVASCLSPAAGAPLIGAIVHTEFTSDSPHVWDGYRNGIGFVESSRAPSAGFYAQDSAQFDIGRQVRQFYAASLDYVLLSWYGGADGTLENSKTLVLRRYVEEISRLNRTAAHRITFAVLVEFGSRHYAARLDFLRSEFYERFKGDALSYRGSPVIALGFNPADSEDDAHTAIGYARSRGFFPFSSRDGKGGGGAFTGLMWRNAPANRVTPLAAVVSPGLDVSGRQSYGRSQPLRATTSQDLELCRNADFASLPCAWIAEADLRISAVPQFKTGHLYVKFATPMAQRVCVAVVNCEHDVAVSCLDRGDLAELEFHEARANCTMRVYAASGRRVEGGFSAWSPPTEMHRLSLEVYDAQWNAIAGLPEARRPAFISIASFNSWTEGTMIEANTVDGSSYLSDTARWAERLRQGD